MKQWLVLSVVGILLLVGGACSSPEVPVPPTEPEPPLYQSISIPIEEFPNHSHIDAVMSALVGQELTVTLGSNPTTGFQWAEAEISEEFIIQEVSHLFVGSGTNVPGASGKDVWVFKALKSGTTTIFMSYDRPWVEEEIGYWTVHITVNIR